MTKITDRILAISKTNYKSFSKLLDKQGLWGDFFTFLRNNENTEERFIEPQKWLDEDIEYFCYLNPKKEIVNKYSLNENIGECNFTIDVMLSDFACAYLLRVSPMIVSISTKLHKEEVEQKLEWFLKLFPSLFTVFFKTGFMYVQNGKAHFYIYNPHADKLTDYIQSNLNKFFYNSLKKLEFLDVNPLSDNTLTQNDVSYISKRVKQAEQISSCFSYKMYRAIHLLQLQDKYRLNYDIIKLSNTDLLFNMLLKNDYHCRVISYHVNNYRVKLKTDRHNRLLRYKDGSIFDSKNFMEHLFCVDSYQRLTINFIERDQLVTKIISNHNK